MIKKSKKELFFESESKGIKVLLGNPRKAILTLSLPMIIAMSFNTIYTIVDALWVSGLGAEALAAIGFVFPFFSITTALSVGLGVGCGSAISRKIGSKDKSGADSVAIHMIIIMLLISLIYTIPFFIFAKNIFIFIGTGKATDMAVAYAEIIFGGTIIIFFTNIANAILRGEGDAKRAMYAMTLGAGLNIVLDPIFIYTLNFGVSGAAWATILSMGISSVLLFYWLFFKNDTYISFIFRGFKFNKTIIKDILTVGLPVSVQQISTAFMIIIINVIVVGIGSTDGVAVYTTGWRIVTIAILPLLGITTAVVSVTGVAYGARSIDKLNTAYMYAIKIGLLIEIIMAVFVFILAPQIAAVFTQAEGANRITNDLVTYLRIICLFFPGAAFGMLSSAMFLGIGKGINSLMITIFRTLILTTPLALLLPFFLGIGLQGVWWGLVTANIIGSALAFVWGNLTIKRMKLKMCN